MRQWLSLEYWGKSSQKFVFKLKKILLSVNIVFTTNKVKIVVANPESSVQFALKSNVMYNYTCPECHRTFIGQKIRLISIRAKEHAAKDTTVHRHFSESDSAVLIEDFEISDGPRNQKLLLTMEALYNHQQKPLLNTKNEFQSWFLSYVFQD